MGQLLGWWCNYDNGANMKGKNVGVHKRIRDMNPKAIFVPCACHSLNLVVCDAAKSSVQALSYFGCLQRNSTCFQHQQNDGLFCNPVFLLKLCRDHQIQDGKVKFPASRCL